MDADRTAVWERDAGPHATAHLEHVAVAETRALEPRAHLKHVVVANLLNRNQYKTAEFNSVKKGNP